jgi:hypothetical protein
MRSLPIAGCGVNGDPLHEGKLDLPELLEVPTPDEWAWARDFIARRKWREAITYRGTAPHEYTVREWEVGGQADQDSDHFTTFIRRFGYADFLHSVRHLYWVIDEKLSLTRPCGDLHRRVKLRLPPGVYLLRLTSGEMRLVRWVTVLH